MSHDRDAFRQVEELLSQGQRAAAEHDFVKAYKLFAHAYGALSVAADKFLGASDNPSDEELYDLRVSRQGERLEFLRQNELAARSLCAMGLARLNADATHADWAGVEDVGDAHDHIGGSQEYLPADSHFAEPYFYSGLLYFLYDADKSRPKPFAGLDWRKTAEQELQAGLQRDPHLPDKAARLLDQVAFARMAPELKQTFLELLNG